MKQIEVLLAQLKPKHGSDFIFMGAGLVAAVVAYIQDIPGLYLVTAFGLFFGVILVFGIQAQIKSFTIIEENYDSNREVALGELNNIIRKLKKGIEIDERKSRGNSREARDSAGDVIRKQAKMKKLVELKNLIENK